MILEMVVPETPYLSGEAWPEGVLPSLAGGQEWSGRWGGVRLEKDPPGYRAVESYWAGMG